LHPLESAAFARRTPWADIGLLARWAGSLPAPRLEGFLVALRFLTHRGLEFLDVCGRQLRPVDLDRQLVELGCVPVICCANAFGASDTERRTVDDARKLAILITTLSYGDRFRSARFWVKPVDFVRGVDGRRIERLSAGRAN
jgi:hypothetical protein